MGVFLDLSKNKWALVTLEYLLVELGPLGRTGWTPLFLFLAHLLISSETVVPTPQGNVAE